MGGPVAVVYLPGELNEAEQQLVEEVMADRTWRLSPDTHDVMTVHIEPISFEHDATEIDELEILIGWRPQQQIQIVCHGNSLIEYHQDLALASARFARQFDGVVMIYADNRCYDEIRRESLRIPSGGFGEASERIVDAAWLDAFVELEDPRFRK